MPRYGVESKLKPEEVIKKAKEYFGESGVGLSVADRDPCCVFFEGGGGHIFVTASEEDRKTQVDLETREWDYQVKHFVDEITSARERGPRRATGNRAKP